MVPGCHGKRGKAGYCTEHAQQNTLHIRLEPGRRPSRCITPEEEERKELENWFAGNEFATLLGFSATDVQSIIGLLKKTEVKAYDHVFEEGQIGGKDLYFVYKGSLHVYYIPVGANKPKRIGDRRLQTGDRVGEISFLFEVLPRSYSVTAQEKSVLLALDRDEFLTFLSEEGRESSRQKFQEYQASRVESIVEQLGIHFFKMVPRDQFCNLLDAFALHVIEKGAPMCTVGEPNTHLHYVLRGRLACDGHVISPGHYFGEMALAASLPSPVTITAVEQTLVLSIGGSDFAGLFKGAMDQYATFALRLAQQKSPLLPIIIHTMGKSYFREFLEDSVNEHHLAFFESAWKYQFLTDDVQRVEAAQNIARRFFDPSAAEQINTRSTVRKVIQQAVNKGVVGPFTFTKSLNEVINMLSLDFLPGFKEQERFDNLLKAVGRFKHTKNCVQISPDYLLHGIPCDPLAPARQRLAQKLTGK